MSKLVRNACTYGAHVQDTYGGVFTRVACLPKSLTKKMKAPAVIDAEATVSKKLYPCISGTSLSAWQESYLQHYPNLDADIESVRNAVWGG